MRVMAGVEWALRKTCALLESAIAFGLGAMVLLVFGNVVLRYGFNSGIAVSEELSRWLFIWCTLLGAVVALREGGHLGVDMLVSRLPAWGKKACLVGSHVLMLFIVALLFVGALDQTRINWRVEAPASGLPMGVMHLAALVFAVLAAAVLLLGLWKVLAGKLSDAELVMIQESEEAAQIKHVLADAGQARSAP